MPFKPQSDLVALDDALNELNTMDPRQSNIVDLRFFGGSSIEDTSQVLGLSPATVKREWTVARLWLQRELRGGVGLASPDTGVNASTFGCVMNVS